MSRMRKLPTVLNEETINMLNTHTIHYDVDIEPTCLDTRLTHHGHFKNNMTSGGFRPTLKVHVFKMTSNAARQHRISELYQI